MRSSLRTRLLLAAAALFTTSSAYASNVTEFPDNGSEQLARGGAWVARASDPLAAFFNPAGLAGQDTKITVQANLSLLNTCFTRVKAANDTSQEPLADPTTGQFPQVCNQASLGPNPQLAATFKLTDRLGLGVAILGPSGVANNVWPEFVNDKNGTAQAAPQRYLLLAGNALLLTPSIGIGWEPTDRLRIGASFQWGIATLSFANSSLAVNDNGTLARDNDVKAELSAKDLFIPGFTLGTLWSPSDMVDLAGWFKWSAPVDAVGDVKTSVSYFRPGIAGPDGQGVPDSKVIHGDTAVADCGTGNPTVTVCGPDKGSVKLPIPMEAKIGVRVHGARPGVSQAHRRDPLSQDLWDAEVDFTFANNQVLDNLQVRFPANVDGVTGVIPINGTGGTLPPNADVPHNYKNVFGVRVGGDFNAIPDRLAIRAGAFFESNGQDPRYQNIDFIGGQRIGLSVGGTFRVPLSKREEGGVRRGSALEFSLGFMHMFVADQTYSDRNATVGVPGLAGSPCNPQSNFVGGKCVDGQPVYRTNWPVNLGTITNALNVINVGASYRF
jgi:long-chain fatty acid transport protein